MGNQKNIKIHIIFKTHLDIGFTNFSKNVIEDYFSNYIPRAIHLAKELRESGRDEGFIWTVGSWLIYQSLEILPPSQRRELEQAIEVGDIAWHGLPFTPHTELMDTSLFKHGLGFSQKLDQRFGKKTIAAKLTDVPGHTRSMIPLLANAGIEFLHIGVNPVSAPPDVPSIFVWRHPDGSEITVMYHKGTYGALMIPENHDAGICFSHTGDNLGPQEKSDVLSTYAQLNEKFPHAEIKASTLNDYAQELRKIKSTLPVITQEIGDTWIHGLGTDPEKVKKYRECCRLRNRWIKNANTPDEKSLIERFNDKLIMIPEHTWGMDLKTNFPNWTHYTPVELAKIRKTDEAKKMEKSWGEQRKYLSQANQVLEQSKFKEELDRAFENLKPIWPDLSLYKPIETNKGVVKIFNNEVAFDLTTGALTNLQHSTKDYPIASAENPLGIFSYEIFSQSDYDRFAKQYLHNFEKNKVWAIPDFTKPGIKSSAKKHEIFSPILDSMYRRKDDDNTILLLLHMPEEAVKFFGAPAKLTIEIRFKESGDIEYTLQLFDKQANRLPEAMWFSFNPIIASPDKWTLTKMGSAVSPLDVVKNGNRHLHAVEKCCYEDSKQKVFLESLDAVLVAPGNRMLLNFTNNQPKLDEGMHFNLYNNLWGTNFPMWYEDNMLFRFKLHFS